MEAQQRQIFGRFVRLRVFQDDQVIGKTAADNIKRRVFQYAGGLCRQIPLRASRSLVSQLRVVFGSRMLVVPEVKGAIAADGQAERPETEQVCQKIIQPSVMRQGEMRAVVAQLSKLESSFVSPSSFR